MSHLTLYHKPGCPYCQKVITFMQQNGISDSTGTCRIILKNRDENPGIRQELIGLGGKPQVPEINARDREIIGVLKPRLQELGLYLVGIDVIGEYLVEVNVTSPTGLQEINKLYGTRGEDKILDFAENLIDQPRR